MLTTQGTIHIQSSDQRVWDEMYEKYNCGDVDVVIERKHYRRNRTFASANHLSLWAGWSPSMLLIWTLEVLWFLCRRPRPRVSSSARRS